MCLLGVMKTNAKIYYHIPPPKKNTQLNTKKLYFGFVDLEKAFDRVPREVIS